MAMEAPKNAKPWNTYDKVICQFVKCPDCGGNDLLFTGEMFATNPPRYIGKCGECERKVTVSFEVR